MAATNGKFLDFMCRKNVNASSMMGTNVDLSSTPVISNMSAPAMKPFFLADVKTTDLTSELEWTSVSHIDLASCMTAKDRVFTFLVRLSKRTMATPAGVISTFWKYSYFREGVGTKGVSAAASCAGDGGEGAGSSFTAAATAENAFALMGRRLELVAASSSLIDAPRPIRECALPPVDIRWLKCRAAARL